MSQTGSATWQHQRDVDCWTADVLARQWRSGEELLQTVADRLGVLAFGIIDLGACDLVAHWSDAAVHWEGILRHIQASSSSLINRAELIRIPFEYGSYNMLLCRLGRGPTEKLWNRAIALVGRRPAEPGGFAGFLTREFPLLEATADRFANPDLEPPQESVWQANSIRDRLAAVFGRRVRLILSDHNLIVSGLRSKPEYGEFEEQFMAESCVRELCGWTVAEQTALDRVYPRESGRAVVTDFRIVIYGTPVYQRRISVRVLPLRIAAEVVVPKGWWWTGRPGKEAITAKEACEIVVKNAQEDLPLGTELGAELVESALWPEGPSRRVVHVIRTRLSGDIQSRFCVCATTGEILSKRRVVRKSDDE